MAVSFSDQKSYRKVKIFSVLFEVLVLDPGFYVTLVLFQVIMDGKHLKIYRNKISIYEEVTRS